MANNWRKATTNLHVVLASYFLPIAVMFAVTGALYTLAIRGKVTESQSPVALAEPLKPDLAVMVKAATDELAKRGLSAPSGSASLRENPRGFSLEWGGVNRELSLQATPDSKEATLVLKEHNLHRRFVQLHKAKGSAVAKTISILWAVGLLALFGTGMAIAFAAPNFRKLAIVSGVFGIITFLAYAVMG